MREIKIFRHADTRPEEWRVEDIDSDGDGGCDVMIFIGPEQRARRFVDWLRTNTD